MSKHDVKNYIFNLKSIYNNYNTIKNLAIECEEVSVEVKHRLIEKKFQKEIEKVLAIIETINQKFLKNTRLHLSDIIHGWLELTVLMKNENFETDFKSLSEDFFDMVGLTAYYLHPAYNHGENLKNLPDFVFTKLHDYLVITLGPKLSPSLHAYEDKQGIFKTLFADYSDPNIFWRETGRAHLDFYKVCQRFTSIPAYTNCWSKDESDDIDYVRDPTEEKKIEEVFYRLKIS